MDACSYNFSPTGPKVILVGRVSRHLGAYVVNNHPSKGELQRVNLKGSPFEIVILRRIEWLFTFWPVECKAYVTAGGGGAHAMVARGPAVCEGARQRGASVTDRGCGGGSHPLKPPPSMETRR